MSNIPAIPGNKNVIPRLEVFVNGCSGGGRAALDMWVYLCFNAVHWSIRQF